MFDLNLHETYIKRCIELAKKGLGSVSPNPLVGAVIVYNDKIIGEGFHKKFGEAHAEVNAVNSVKDKNLLKFSTLYVSLEPCSHFGKTPPCTDLILKENIPNIVIGSLDPFELVKGNGIKILKNNNRTVITGILEKECINLNRRFFTFHQKKRPYVILKWAQTIDGYIDTDRKNKLYAEWITNEFCKTLVHKWRTEEDAFLVGTNTVLLDNPKLTARNWFGKNPIRITIDKKCYLDMNKFNIFDNTAKTIIFNEIKNEIIKNIQFVRVDFSKEIIPQILQELFLKNIQSIVIEGGTYTLQKFIDSGIWDEARVFTGNRYFGNGVKAPIFKFVPSENVVYGNVSLNIFYNNEYV